MTNDGGLLIRGEEQKIRDANASDIGGSEPTPTGSELIPKSSPTKKKEVHIPEEIREAARERSLARKIRENHGGEGFVLVNTENGRILDIVENLSEARSVIEAENLSADESLVVFCNER